MKSMRIKKETKSGLELGAMMMAQGSGRSEDARAADTDQGTRQPTRSGSRVPKGMVRIEGGTISGTNPLAEGEAHSILYPATYSITVDDFLMDKYLVTKGLWDDVRNDPATAQHGYTDLPEGGGQGVDHPVHTVSWFDAVKWLNARSERAGREPVYYLDAAYTQVFTSGSGRSRDEYWDVHVKASANGYRLPTMDEWEYAARGGLQSKRFPWGDRIDHKRANYRVMGSSCSYDTSPNTPWGYHPTYATGSQPYTSPVGSFAANGYGLYDMAGNVWEWCSTASGSFRVVRGGSWDYNAGLCRVASRYSYYPDFAYDFIGFQSVLPPGQ